MKVNLWPLALISIYLSPAVSWAVQNIYDKNVVKIYHKLEKNSKSDISSKLYVISGEFIDRPYLLGALGEGYAGKFDQSPLYRTDLFDCETYVDTVLAIAFAKNLHGFQQCINQIRYKKGEVSFVTRNHFTSLDWNPNNQQNGFIRDITKNIKDKNNRPAYRMAAAMIDKPEWYARMKADAIKLAGEQQGLKQQRLEMLRAEGKKFKTEQAKIPYLPLNVLFNTKKEPDMHLFGQIPDASIVEIVRPNWNLQKQIGTHLNVSHMGFVFWKNGRPIFRQASSVEGKVVDVPLVAYLEKMLDSPTIKGINIQIVMQPDIRSQKCQNI